MSVLANITEGWTGELGPFILKSGTTPVVFNLTGMTVTLVARDSYGRPVTVAGTVRVGVAANGEVYFTPAATDFKANGNQSRSYLVHFKVVDGANKVVYFPNGQPDEFVIWPQ